MNHGYKFLMKSMIFVLPFCIIIYLLLLTGENMNSGYMSKIQHIFHKPALYGTIYKEDQYKYYKAAATKTVEPDVLVLGASTALSVRSVFFNHDVNVYNAGDFSMASFADMEYFLKETNVKNISTVIVAINPFQFNENFTKVKMPTHNNYTSKATGNGTTLSELTHKTWNAIISHDYKIRDILNKPEFFGLNAKIKKNGYLNDGSFFYGELYQKYDGNIDPEIRLKDTLNRVENANSRFEHGDHASDTAVKFMHHFLQYCTDNSIYVIAYIPPYAPTVNKAMSNKGQNAYAYHTKLVNISSKMFSEFGFEFYDYTDIRSLNCTDDFFIDGFHSGDVAYARMFIDMMNKGSRLNEYCDINHLKKLDDNRYSNFRIFNTCQEYNEDSLLRQKITH